MRYYIDIDKDAIPYRFSMRLAGITYMFEVRYNAEYDFFTVDLYRGNELIAAGEKITYGRPLFEEEIQGVKITPLDLSGNDYRAGWDELNESVFLYLEGEGFD